MISKETLQQLQADERKVHFILGARLRNVKEIYQDVLSRAGRYREVRGPREKSTDPSPLKVKEVCVDERRYVVCLNVEQSRKDRADREAIVASLREQLAARVAGGRLDTGSTSPSGPSFRRRSEVESEKQFDGELWCDGPGELRRRWLQYKQLYVESRFRCGTALLAVSAA